MTNTLSIFFYSAKVENGNFQNSKRRRRRELMVVFEEKQIADTHTKKMIHLNHAPPINSKNKPNITWTRF